MGQPQLSGLIASLILFQATASVIPCGAALRYRNGKVIPTGAEGREIERQRADRLAERLWAMRSTPMRFNRLPEE